MFLLFDPKDPHSKDEAESLNHRLVRRAIRMEGTCTGEHGIGIGKKEFLSEELGQDAVDLMKTLKHALDPNGLFFFFFLLLFLLTSLFLLSILHLRYIEPW